jgi:hypothetical protein
MGIRHRRRKEYDIIKTEILCPICGKLTPHECQTKAFQCDLDILDINNLPFENLGKYYGKNSYEILYWYSNRYYGRKWRLKVPIACSCNKCGTLSYGNIEFVNHTYQAKKKTNNWDFFKISLFGTNPETILLARHKMKYKPYRIDWSKDKDNQPKDIKDVSI